MPENAAQLFDDLRMLAANFPVLSHIAISELLPICLVTVLRRESDG